MDVQRCELVSAIKAATRPADEPRIWLSRLLQALAPTMGKELGVVGHFFQFGQSQELALRTMQAEKCPNDVFEEVQRATAQSPAALIDRVFGMYSSPSCDFASNTFRALQASLPTRPRETPASPDDVPPVREAFGLFLPASAGAGVFLTAPMARPLAARPRQSQIDLWREFTVAVQGAHALQRKHWTPQENKHCTDLAHFSAGNSWQRLLKGEITLTKFEFLSSSVRLRIAVRPSWLTRDFLALTPSECRVAELAALGCCNKTISDELKMTMASVNTHLQRLLYKLGLDRREYLCPLYRALEKMDDEQR